MVVIGTAETFNMLLRLTAEDPMVAVDVPNAIISMSPRLRPKPLMMRLSRPIAGILRNSTRELEMTASNLLLRSAKKYISKWEKR